MSKVRFISDLHLGHKHICEFSGALRSGVTTVEQHDAWIIEQWNSVVQKSDLVYVLGDICFDKTKLPLLKRLTGSKHLIFGNHEKFPLKEYLPYFNKIHGFLKYKGQAWLSHAPIHPEELRGLINIHGHLHHRSIDDHRYFNVSVEKLQGKPITWEDLLKLQQERMSMPPKLDLGYFNGDEGIMRIKYHSKNKIELTLNLRQFLALRAALDSVTSIGEEDNSGNYTDVFRLEDSLIAAIHANSPEIQEILITGFLKKYRIHADK